MEAEMKRAEAAEKMKAIAAEKKAKEKAGDSSINTYMALMGKMDKAQKIKERDDYVNPIINK